MESLVKRYARDAAVVETDKDCNEFYWEKTQCSSMGWLMERTNWEVIFMAQSEMHHAP